MPRHLPTVLALLLSALAAACGGSGGGGGGVPAPVVGPATFTGTYFAVLYSGGHSPAAEGLATTGILVADGAGGAAHSETSNLTGVVSGPTTTPYTYTVAADGTLELFAGPTLFARGGISADGERAVLGSIASGAFAGILVLHRRQGVHDDTSLTGIYHLVTHALDPTFGDSGATTGSAAFDGGGNVAGGAATSNTMGSLVAGPFGSGIYSVIADGTSAYAPASMDLEGGVSGDGAVGLWGGGLVAGQLVATVIAVRETSAAGPGTFQGRYWVVSFERDPAGGDFRSFTGTATSDGSGGLTLVGTSNTEGVIAAEPPGATTYTVTPTGRLTVDAGGSVLAGGVTADGRFAALGGGTTLGSPPTLVVLARK
jgi:hypothetical protein